MKSLFKVCALLTLLCAGQAVAEDLVLESVKDTFGRSNQRNRNNGGASELLVLHAPLARTIVSFDLTGITNEIVSAEFSFRQANTMDSRTPIDLVVAPMRWTESNAAWVEGTGNVGTRGQNAQEGEATFAWRSFRDIAWQSGSGKDLANLGDGKLWLPPVATLKRLDWIEGEWVKVTINDLTFLEKIRESEAPIVTFGLWGTGGNGFYFLNSKESGFTPKLTLTLKEEEPVE